MKSALPVQLMCKIAFLYLQITIDGIGIEQLNVSWLRRHIGVVSQEPVLFEGSIAENIRMGKDDATDQEIEQAAQNANAHKFISELPKVG